MADLYQGAVAPETYILKVQTGDSGLDMTTVSAAVIKVHKGGAVATWTAALSGATAALVTLTHSFSAAPSEADVTGDYIIWAELTVPGGTLTTGRVRRGVRGRYEANS